MLPSKVARDFASSQSRCKLVATDFYAQEQVILTQGGLRSAVAASMALPALFTPVTREGRVLMDGGLVNPLPFDVLRARPTSPSPSMSAAPPPAPASTRSRRRSRH